jgi:hypothetical protein
VPVFNKNEQEEDCLICYNKLEIGSGIILKQCNHGYFCMGCLEEHILAQMKEGNNDVECLEEGCK